MRGFSLLLIGVAACSFPAITFDDDGGGGGTDSVGGGGNGASTNSTGGGAADPVGGGGSGAGPIGGGGSGSGGGPLNCDVDEDGFQPNIDRCDNSDGIDCDDNDERANPDQTEFFDFPRENGSYDWDCDGIQEPKYATSCSCSVPVALQVPSGADGCGETGDLKNCTGFLTCGANGNADTGVKQPCN